MVVVNNKSNEAYYNVSKVAAAKLVGVNRSTIKFWEEKRIADETFKEEYNHFTIYFKSVKLTQSKGGHLQLLCPINAAKDR